MSFKIHTFASQVMFYSTKFHNPLYKLNLIQFNDSLTLHIQCVGEKLRNSVSFMVTFFTPSSLFNISHSTFHCRICFKKKSHEQTTEMSIIQRSVFLLLSHPFLICCFHLSSLHFSSLLLMLTQNQQKLTDFLYSN